MFHIVDTAFSYGREWIVWIFLQDFSEGKGSSLQLICNAHTVFLFCWAVWAQINFSTKYERSYLVEKSLILLQWSTKINYQSQFIQKSTPCQLHFNMMLTWWGNSMTAVIIIAIGLAKLDFVSMLIYKVWFCTPNVHNLKLVVLFL